jgi:hypothetical protein
MDDEAGVADSDLVWGIVGRRANDGHVFRQACEE